MKKYSDLYDLKSPIFQFQKSMAPKSWRQALPPKVPRANYCSLFITPTTQKEATDRLLKFPRENQPATTVLSLKRLTMVVSLGPGKFYGSSLPRPRIYTDVKLNPDRVDPPLSVMDPFLSWAEEAHWSMGGLSFKRLRLQGRIEGNVNKLRKHREKLAKSQVSSSPKVSRGSEQGDVKDKNENNRKRVGSDAPPPAPMVTKRRKFMDLFDEDSEEEELQAMKEVEAAGKKKPVRKLAGDFEKVAKINDVNNTGKIGNVIGLRTRRRGLEEGGSGGMGDAVMKVVKELNVKESAGKKLKGGRKGKSGGESGSNSVSGIRTSPRLANQRSN